MMKKSPSHLMYGLYYVALGGAHLLLWLIGAPWNE